ncbi:MAG: MotA/TolQ/ExbB proton channel family protein [bacterium]|nr:MotA/TolQ/ExbB proton channel family protein [bacterium]
MEVETTPSVLSMVFASGPVVQIVLLILIGLSFWTWAITISKFIRFRQVERESALFISTFWEIRNLPRIHDAVKKLTGSPLANIFETGFVEVQRLIETAKKHKDQNIDLDTELKTIERALKREEFAQFKKLSDGTTFLATVATAAPFIGLFGTVWGIMTAFQGLSTSKAATIQAVAPGISEALVATAIGLAAAIPASIAYNYFSSVIKGFRESMDSFTAEFVNMAERYLV